MKKRILSMVLAMCLVLTLCPTMAFAGNGIHTVTVNAGEGGKVSTDGTSWSNSVTVAVNDGETLNGKVQYKADKGYGFDGIVPKIASIATGTNHTVLLDANGNVWTTGYNVYGQLGFSGGTTSTFKKVTGGIGGVKITAIAAGTKHTVLLDKDGNVWTAGHNYYGQLGRDENSGTDKKNSTFTQVTVGDGVKIKAIAAGANHTVLLDANGNVWTAGYNVFGQLGRDENKNTHNANPTFTQVTVGNGIKIKAIATSYDHTVLLDKDGNVWTAGYNNYGQLGRDENEKTSNANPTFTKVTNGISDVKIAAIAGGGNHTVLLDEYGNVWTVGNNDSGQLGFSGGTNSTFTQITGGIGGVNITDIAAGYNYTILLDENGNVWTAGYNYYGQLGRDENSGTNNKNTTFKQVTNGISSGVSITAIAAKFSHTVLLDEDGNVWIAGSNIYGQIGNNENFGTNNANPTFKQATVNLNAITFDEFVNIPIHNNSVFLTKFKDIQGPVITGLESNKTYCYAVQFEVSDNSGVASVKSGDTVLTTGENGKYTLATVGIGTLTIVATDTIGNTTEVTVTVKDEHSGGTATCTAKAVCEYCGEEYGKTAHNNHTSSKKWVYNDYQHSQYWECCRVVVVNYTDHIWNNGVCSVCDYVCTHKDNDKNHLCDICGKTISDHTWSDGVCSVCGYVCTHKDENPKDYLCDYCGKKYGGVTSEAELNEAISSGADLIRLLGNVKLSSLLDLTDKIITLDLNGYVLTGNIKLADNSAAPNSILTLIDSRPTATHSDSSLPVGGVLNGNITLTRGSGSVSHLYANGGTVTGQTSLPSYAGGIYCTSDTPTAFKAYVGNYGGIYGGIFYSGINTDCIKEKTVTFMNGSSRYALEVVAAGNKVVAPISPSPSNAGYQTFIGWYNGDTKYTFGSTISESITLTAKYSNPITYNISYNLDGGTATNPATYNVESNAITLNNPVKTGYTFTGWSGTGLTGENNMTVTIAKGSTGDRTYTAHFSQNNYTVKFDTNGGSSISDKTSVKWTDKVLDGITPPTKDGWELTGWKCANVTVNENTKYSDLAANDTVASVTLVAQWKDITAPTGEISIGTNKWNGFLNTITFGLFFKDTQSVTITAVDNSGDSVKIEYLLSNKALSEAELVSATFTSYTKAFSINPDNKYVIYAKLTDKVGNVSYLNTTGIVLDATAPVITGIENGKTYCSAQTVSVSDNEGIKSVTVNGTEVTIDSNNQFILNPAEGTQTIVVTDKAGNVSSEMIVTVNNGHTYEWQSNNSQYWQKCSICGYETAKKDIPTITINGADKVCLTQDYVLSFTLPEGVTNAVYGFDFGVKGDGFPAVVENNEAQGVIYATWYISNADSFEVYAGGRTADGFPFTVSKTVLLQKEHTGGEATCIAKAICDTCGEEYGEINLSNHTHTEIRNVIQATCTETGYSGDKYCTDCGILLEKGKITDIAPHSFQTTVIEPTENKQGYTKHTCKDCRYSYIDNITEFASDNSALIAVLETIESCLEEDYSAQSFANLQSIYNQYSSMATGSYTQLEIDNAVFDLLTAISELEPYLNLNTSASYGTFTVTYNNETNSNFNHSLLFGTNVTLNATAKEGYEFVGWYDTINNLYFSKNAEYSFKLTTNTSLKAVFVKEQSATLTFATYSNWVQSTVTKTIAQWNSVSSIDGLLPEVPYKYGYSNGRWVYNNAEVLAKLQTGENVTLIPEYDEDNTSLPTPPSPKGYTPVLDLYYKLDAGANVGSFVMAAGIPENCKIESVGILFYYKNANEFDPTSFELLTNNKMLAGRFNTDEKEDIYIVNMNKMTSKYNWAARGYVSYYDANGNLKTVYSNQVNIVNREQV